MIDLFEAFTLSVKEIFELAAIGVIKFDVSDYSSKNAISFYNQIVRDDMIILYCHKSKENEVIILENSKDIFSFWKYYCGEQNIKTSKLNNWNSMSKNKKDIIYQFKILLIQKFK